MTIVCSPRPLVPNQEITPALRGRRILTANMWALVLLQVILNRIIKSMMGMQHPWAVAGLAVVCGHSMLRLRQFLLGPRFLAGLKLGGFLLLSGEILVLLALLAGLAFLGGSRGEEQNLLLTSFVQFRTLEVYLYGCNLLGWMINIWLARSAWIRLLLIWLSKSSFQGLISEGVILAQYPPFSRHAEAIF